MHYGVAQLATKIHRVGEFVGLVAANGAYQREDHHETEQKGDGTALGGIVEIQSREMRRGTYSAKPAPPLDHHSDGGRRVTGEEVNDNKQNDVGKGNTGQRQTDQADWISNEILRNRRMIA